MSDNINEILARADRYRGKAAAIKAAQYTADVDCLMAEIDRLNAENVQLKQHQPGYCAGCAIAEDDCIVDKNARLEAENAELKRENASWGDYIADKDKQLDFADAENKKLKQQLDEVNARLGAAVEDMNVMALAMRESDELSETCCFACICDAQNMPDDCILSYGECPGYDTTDCFQWRYGKDVIR